MARVLLKRLSSMAATFLGITVVTFAIIHLAPGEPSSIGSDLAQTGFLSRQSMADFRRAMGMDRPLPVRYGLWLRRVASLDFGVSSYDHRPVIDKLAEALPNTLLLSGLALALAYLLGMPLGATAAVTRHRWIDRLLSQGLVILYSVPAFWAAVMLLIFLGGGRYLDLFPMQGLHSPGIENAGVLLRLRDLAWHLVLPVACLAYSMMVSVSGYMRGGLLDTMREDYVRTARAKGLSEIGVLRHMLRNAMLPLVTLAGLSVPQLIGGSVVVEQIFGIPGMGRLGYETIATRDYNTLMAVTTLTALLTMVGTALSDIAYFLVDPRIRSA